MDSEVVGTYMGVEVKFRDVWQDNLEQQFEVIRNILDEYPYVGMVRRPPSPSLRATLCCRAADSNASGVRPPRQQDTEFPGVVARPIGQFTGNADYHYQTLRCNCDLLKIIQLVRALPRRAQLRRSLPAPIASQFASPGAAR